MVNTNHTNKKTQDEQALIVKISVQLTIASITSPNYDKCEWVLFIML
jgi:hypothetical protein